MERSENKALREQRALQIFAIFIVPPLCIYFNVLNKDWRLMILFVATILLFGIIRKEQWTLSDLGITSRTPLKYLLPYLVATLAAVTLIVQFSEEILPFGPEADWWHRSHFLWIFLVISFLQEFAFRGFLMPALRDLFSHRITVIVSNAALFSFMHIMYPFPVVSLPLAFLAGLLFAFLYDRYPSLVLVTLCHAVLNFTAVLYGFFIFPS